MDIPKQDINKIELLDCVIKNLSAWQKNKKTSTIELVNLTKKLLSKNFAAQDFNNELLFFDCKYERVDFQNKIKNKINQLQEYKKLISQELNAERIELCKLSWKYLFHPTVKKVSYRLFKNKHYAEAVSAAFVELDNQVKALYRSKTNDELSGVDLMRKTFKLNSPVYKLSDLNSETERNIQDGYMNLFVGAMQAIRNPKAHENIRLNDQRKALQLLSLASLLFYKLDETKQYN